MTPPADLHIPGEDRGRAAGVRAPFAGIGFRSAMLGLGATTFCASAISVVDYGLKGRPDSLTHACLWLMLALLALIAARASSADRFLFSCAFWVTVEFLFYIVLKAVASMDELDAGFLQLALLSSLLFLLGYWIGQLAWPMPSLLRPAPLGASKRLYWWLVASFIGFKLLNYLMLLLIGGGATTTLELAQNTQNQGAAYLFKIPILSQFSYFLVLLLAYKHRHYRKTAIVMTLIVLLDAVISASRAGIITTILINLLLRHLYVKPIRLSHLVLLTPPLIFVVAFFGYVRDIELASADVYLNALGVFIDERELMFKLFMNRMDMLPQMAQAFQLDQAHQLKNVGGLSYVYSFLHAIPRNIWPDKPPLTAAYLTEAVDPDLFAAGINIYPSIMVEAYMNFLWPGIVFMGFLLAALSVAYERALRRGSLQVQAFALVAFTFPMAFINEGFHSNSSATLLYLMFIYWLWLRLTRWLIGSSDASRLALP
jgi:oligosaccharide repeat unit polymerase